MIRSSNSIYCWQYVLKITGNLTGCLVDSADKEGNTALHIAARYGHELLIGTLLKLGASLSRYGRPVWKITAVAFQWLMNVGTATRRGCVGMLPIHMSALNGYLDCVKKMLSFTPGFQIDTPDNMGRTCLHAAACGGCEAVLLIYLIFITFISISLNVRVADTLTSSSSSFQAEPTSRCSITTESMSTSHWPVTNRWRHTCWCSVVCFRTPLHYAAANCHYSVVVSLVLAGSKVNVQDVRGCTPLHYAAAADTNAKYNTKLTNELKCKAVNIIWFY